MYAIYIILFIALFCLSMVSGEPSIDERILNAAESDKQFREPRGLTRMEGDIMMTIEQYMAWYGKGKRNGLKSFSRRWKNGMVPYIITKQFFSSSDIEAIRGGIKAWEDNTCLRFLELDKPQRAYRETIRFISGGGCWSMVGPQGREQRLSLSRGCRHHSTVVHELGHALGLFHEQARSDRDKYITIIWDNIKKGREYNFRKKDTDIVGYFGVDYDYYSVMHYSKSAFSKKRGLQTIRTKQTGYDNVIGRVDGLSFGDVKMMNNMYKCGEKCGGSCPKIGFMNKDCQCICPGNLKEGLPTKPCSKNPKTKRTKKPNTKTTTDDSCVTVKPKPTNPPTRTKKPKLCQYKDKLSRCKEHSFRCGRNDYIDRNCEKTCKCKKVEKRYIGSSLLLTPIIKQF